MRELDARLAQGLGYEAMKSGDKYCKGATVTQYVTIEATDIKTVPCYATIKPVLHYSTDGNAMLELDREMRARGWEIEVEFTGTWCEIEVGTTGTNYRASFYKDGRGWAGECFADTMPLAVALAAHKALFGEDYNGE